MIFTPLPGEYVASAIRRGNETLGAKGINRIDYQIKKNPTTKRGRIKEIGKFHKEGTINYPALFEKHGVTESVLRENTLYPLAAALGQNKSSCIYTPTKSWKICLHCVVEDLKEQGTAYIHRRNLLASVNVCSIHASTLYDRCPTCLTKITTHKISELANCSKYFHEIPKAIGSPKHLYSKFISDLLNYKGKPFTRRYIEFSLYAKLKSLGYLEHKNEHEMILNFELKEQLETKINILYIEHLSIDACAASTFIAYKRADDYLAVIDDNSACEALKREVSKIERRRWELSLK